MDNNLKHTPLQKWLLAFFLAQFLNFFTFAGVSGILGGDGLNGKIEDGAFFVSSHGNYTQVTRIEYQFSRLQAETTIALHIPAFLCFLIVARKWKGKSRSMWTANFSPVQWILIFSLPGFWWIAFSLIKLIQ
jgi:hypothetical protein